MAKVKLMAQCSYCKRFYRFGPTLNGRWSHGICPQCYQCYVEQIEKPKNDEGVYHGS